MKAIVLLLLLFPFGLEAHDGSHSHSDGSNGSHSHRTVSVQPWFTLEYCESVEGTPDSCYAETIQNARRDMERRLAACSRDRKRYGDEHWQAQVTCRMANVSLGSFY